MRRHECQQRPSPSTEPPVLTLWAAVVAKRLGFDEDESLSLGKALAGLNAHTKGRSWHLQAERGKGEEGTREGAGRNVQDRTLRSARTRQEYRRRHPSREGRSGDRA